MTGTLLVHATSARIAGSVRHQGVLRHERYVRLRDRSIGLRQTSLVSLLESVYAQASGGRIGHQVAGAGPPDVLAT